MIRFIAINISPKSQILLPTWISLTKLPIQPTIMTSFLTKFSGTSFIWDGKLFNRGIHQVKWEDKGFLWTCDFIVCVFLFCLAKYVTQSPGIKEKEMEIDDRWMLSGDFKLNSHWVSIPVQSIDDTWRYLGWLHWDTNKTWHCPLLWGSVI